MRSAAFEEAHPAPSAAVVRLSGQLCNVKLSLHALRALSHYAASQITLHFLFLAALNARSSEGPTEAHHNKSPQRRAQKSKGKAAKKSNGFAFCL